eukprot:Skav207375  [mRNA]  locus=scaffold2496:44808:55787:+ [translate_table: standard]
MAVAMLQSLPLREETSRRESAKYLRNRFRPEGVGDFVCVGESGLCAQAAGLELVVRAWWRGARQGSGRKEVAWLKKTASGGVMGGAHDRLLRCGIPERVLHSGVELGQVLAQDKGVTKNWHDDANRLK